MNQQPVPYRKTVFVCTTACPDGEAACANPDRGGDKIWEALKKKVKEAGLAGKVRVSKSGCLDLCEHGPNIFVYPDGCWYSGVQEKDLPELLAQIVGPPAKSLNIDIKPQ